MTGDTEREALTEVIAGTYTVFSDDHGELAEAILAKFLPDALAVVDRLEGDTK